MNLRRVSLALLACLIVTPIYAATCEGLKTISLENTMITSAETVAAGQFSLPATGRGAAQQNAAFKQLPAFCRVAMTLKPSTDSDIKVEVWLPMSNWNNKYQAVGNGGWAGVIMGILLIILLIWEGTQLAEMPMNLSIGVTPTKGTAYLGFAVVIFGLLKFIFAITNEGSLGAWIGLVLLIAIGYGSWMKFQEPETVAAPPASGGSDGGFTA